MIRNERGLTLIELCMTLIILGLIVAAASPQLVHSIRNLKTKNAAESLAENLLMIQQRAILSGRNWRFKVWEDGRGYTVEKRVFQDIPETPNALRQESWKIHFEQALPATNILHPPAAVWNFWPDGTMTDLNLTISDDKNRNYQIYADEKTFKVKSTDRSSE
ncbi:MAG: Tfp pilus assembly protein FimT/FimU [bacterium]